MEEILASIRRIIADDETAAPAAATPPAAPANAPAAKAEAPPPKPAMPPPAVVVAEAHAAPPPPPAVSPDDIDTMLAGFEAATDEAAAQPVPAEDADVLELTEAMEARPPPQATFRTIEPAADVMFAEPPPPPPRRGPASAAPPRYDANLMSEDATAAVTSAFGSLAHTVLVQNARTLDDLVREMLRPMLKSWLDDNLPTIVERLVRAEIERVSRGRGA